MVPAVTEVCLAQPAHSQVQALVCNCEPLPWPQAGRQSLRVGAPRRGISRNERGKSATRAAGELMFNISSMNPAPPPLIAGPDAAG